MSFKNVPQTKEPKHLRMLQVVEQIDKEEAEALWNLLSGDQVSAEQVSLAIAEEMPKYTGQKELQTLSARQILRIRKGQLRA